MRASLLALVSLFACGERRFLGERIGENCSAHERCVTWASEHALRARYLEYRDEPLRAYANAVADRIARANDLPLRPRVVIAEHGPTASAVGVDLIFINRMTLALFDSEDELAAVLAHELVHLDAGHPRPPDIERTSIAARDMESIADERAIGLLRIAGYAPDAMLDMLRGLHRGVDRSDSRHPALLHRLARTAALVGDTPTPRSPGARDQYRRHIDGLVLGVDPRLIVDIDDTLVSMVLDVAIDARLPAIVELKGTIVGRRLGDHLASTLAQRREHSVAGKRILTGIMPSASLSARERSPTERVLDQALARSIDLPPEGSHVILVRGERDLLVRLTGKDLDHATSQLVRAVRVPTDAERAKLVPYRLRFVPSTADGTYARAAHVTCSNHAESSSTLDDPDRIVTRGEPIKCAVRQH